MSRHLRHWLLAALLWLPQVQAADTAGQASLPFIAVVELPAEARDTLCAIKQGGPLPECYYSTDHYRTFKRIRE